jgi:hypothetical protein
LITRGDLLLASEGTNARVTRSAPSVFVSSVFRNSSSLPTRIALSPSDPCVVHEHVEVIRSFRKLTRRGCDTIAIGNVDFQESRLAALLCDFVCRFAACITISRTDKHVKSFGRELTRNFAADASIGSYD